MATHSPSASNGQYGLMAAVWLVLIAMFLGALSASQINAEKAESPASPLDALAARASVGEAPRTSAPIPVAFFNDGSAALTDAGRDWLALFARRAPVIRPGERLRLDIIPLSAQQELTAARVATVVALLNALGADMSVVELGTCARNAGAFIRLAEGRA